MAKKKHKQYSHQSVTLSPGAQSKLARQRRRQKITRWASIGVISLIVLILGAGLVSQWLLPVYLPLQKTILTVNGSSYNARYVSKMVNLYSGGDPSYASVFIDMVLAQIQENELMKQAAADMGITVTDAEVKEKLADSGLDDNAVTRDIIRASLLREKIYAEYIEGLVPVTTEQRQALVMLLEDSAQAEEVEARLEAGESFADIAAELSLDETTAENGGDMGFHPAGFLDRLLSATGLNEAADIAQLGDIGYIFDETASKKLGYWIVKVTERATTGETPSAHVYGILLSNLEDAQEARQRLIDGEDFATIAEEMSQDTTSKNNGGDLGSLSPNTENPVAYDEFVFNEENPLEVPSEPIQTTNVSTTGGWWLYKIAGFEQNREISEDDRSTLLDEAFIDWLTGVKDDPSNEIEEVELSEELRDLIAEQAAD